MSGFQTRSYNLTPCNVRLLLRCFLLHLFPKPHPPIKKQYVQYPVKASPMKRVEQGSWPDNYPLAMIKSDLKTVEDPSTQDIFIAHHDYRGRLDWRESNDFYST
jgi:hypothetical protein